MVIGCARLGTARYYKKFNIIKHIDDNIRQ